MTIRVETVIIAGSGVGGLAAIPDGGRDRPPEVCTKAVMRLAEHGRMQCLSHASWHKTIGH